MARIVQKKGSGAFSPTGSPSTPPGLTVTQQFDDGEALISIVVPFQEITTIATANVEGFIRIDEEAAPGAAHFITIGAGGFGAWTTSLIRRLTAGIHTIDVRMSGFGGGTLASIAAMSTLTIVQLPEWERNPTLEEPG